ncbi:MAG TPA: hypothetical protein VIS99_03195 [Terrimicrobiaceae bacterium]
MVASLKIICDNYAMHKHPGVKARLVRAPPFAFYPDLPSWLNLMDAFSPKSRARSFDWAASKVFLNWWLTYFSLVGVSNSNPPDINGSAGSAR